MAHQGRRIRILYLIDHLSATGGAERFAVGLATNLPRDRFEPWFCSTREVDVLALRQLTEAGVPDVNLGRRAKWDAYRLSGLATLLRRKQFDILHTHKFGSNVWGTLIGRACRVPVIVAHEHSWSYEGDPLRAWLDGHVIGRLATRFIAVSSADGRRMVSREGVSPAKVVVMPNAYIPSETVPGADLRRELGLSAQTPVIAIAAQLRPEKRLDLLLEAHAHVLFRVTDAHLVIAGDGECRPALEHQARRLGSSDLVHFLGRRADVDDILRAAEVAALTSDREGSPLLVFECMANRTPIVATKVGAVPDLVQDGVTGLLVARRDPVAFADALVTLLTDPARRTAMASAAGDRLVQFTIGAAAARFAELYETLVAQRD